MANIPSDVWHEITSYILYRDVQALLACGSYTMSAKIIQSLKKVEAHVELFDKFPFSAFNLPQIEILTLKRMYPISNCVLTLNGASILPSNPIITLKSLELDFAQSLSIFAYTVPSCPPSAIFPNLISLRLSDGIGLITPSMFQSLPDCLETLFIHPCPAGSKSAFPSSVFQCLPRNLQYLHLGYAEIAFNAGEMQFLPKLLKRLYLQSLVASSPDSIGTFPPLLEELELWYRCGYRTASAPRFSVSIFPPSLRRIQCHGLNFILDSPLPPHIEDFGPRLDYGTLSGEALLDCLPKSLTSLPQGIFTASMMKNRFSERFPRIASVSIWEKMGPMPFDKLFEQGLPPALTTFIASHSEPTSDMRVQFPATLTRLQCFATASWLQNLPSGLQSLDLRGSSSDPSKTLKESDWNHLPSGLTHLSCTGAALGPPENLSLLHRLSALKSLAMTSLQPKWLGDPSVPLKWPQTLEDMEIAGAEMQNMEWLSSLSSLTHLHTLSLLGKFNPSLGSSHLDKLPKGLRSMRIRWMPIEGFVGLPDSLRMLHITLFAADFDSARLRGFPTKLQSLYILGGETPAVDPDILLPLLPTCLSEIFISYLDGHVHKAMMKRYYSDPKWGNVLNALSED